MMIYFPPIFRPHYVPTKLPILQNGNVANENRLLDSAATNRYLLSSNKQFSIYHCSFYPPYYIESVIDRLLVHSTTIFAKFIGIHM